MEAEVLLASVLGVDRSRLLIGATLSADQSARFAELIQIRVETGRPVAYLVGQRGFFDLELSVDERVLVPRPETEHAVEVLLALLQSGGLPEGPVVDRGTGSGAIVLALAPRLAGPLVGVDISSDALEVARLNRDACLSLTDARKVSLVRSDCLSCFAGGSVAAVIANPPYIRSVDFDGLPDDVRIHEPRVALVPEGGSPSEHFGRLIHESARVLKPAGWLVTEVGQGQATDVAEQLRHAGWESVGLTEDLAGIARIVAGRHP